MAPIKIEKHRVAYLKVANIAHIKSCETKDFLSYIAKSDTLTFCDTILRRKMKKVRSTLKPLLQKSRL